MKTALLILLFSATTTWAAEPTIPGPPDDDPVGKAGSYAGAISTWRHLPKVWLNECDRVDAKGSQERLKIYEAWMSANQEELARADDLVSRSANRALPKSSGVDPGKGFSAAVFIQVSRQIYLMDATEKADICAHYADQAFFHDSPDEWRNDMYQ